jgi:hypothetical protein
MTLRNAHINVLELDIFDNVLISRGSFEVKVKGILIFAFDDSPRLLIRSGWSHPDTFKGCFKTAGLFISKRRFNVVKIKKFMPGFSLV